MLSAADIASMTAVVAGALDVTITVQRKGTGQDAYGHPSGTFTTTSTAKVNIFRPTATMLTAYANLIASQRTLAIRFMPTSDIREGDQIVYQGLNWLVHEIFVVKSYTFVNEALISVVV